MVWRPPEGCQRAVLPTRFCPSLDRDSSPIRQCSSPIVHGGVYGTVSITGIRFTFTLLLRGFTLNFKGLKIILINSPKNLGQVFLLFFMPEIVTVDYMVSPLPEDRKFYRHSQVVFQIRVVRVHFICQSHEYDYSYSFFYRLY